MTNLPVIYTVGNMNFLDLAEELKDTYRFVISSAPITARAKDLGIQAASLEDAVDNELTESARAEALWLQYRVQEAMLAGSLVALDPAIRALRPPEWQHWFPGLTIELLNHIIIRLQAAERIIEEHGIDGVFLHEDATLEARILLLLGKKYEVPIVQIPHANHFVAPKDDIHAEIKSDYLGVYGEYMKNWYIEAGVDPAIIEVVGAAQWDKAYKEADALDQDHAKRCLGLKEEAEIWLYASTWAQSTEAWGRGQEDLFDSFWRLVEAARDNGNVDLLVKLHPHEGEQSVERYKNIAEQSGIRVIFTPAYLYHCLAAADLVVTQGSSNIAVEAAIFGKPVLELYQPGTRYPEKYGIPGTWGEEFEGAINAAKAWDYHEFLSDMNFGPGSVERTVAWLGEKFNVVNKK